MHVIFDMIVDNLHTKVMILFHFLPFLGYRNDQFVNFYVC